METGWKSIHYQQQQLQRRAIQRDLRRIFNNLEWQKSQLAQAKKRNNESWI